MDMTETELSALLRRQAAEIAREGHNGWGNTMMQAAAELERLRIGHERYETVRRMSVPQFKDAFVLSIRTGKPFDQTIDEMRPFVRPNAAPTSADLEG